MKYGPLIMTSRSWDKEEVLTDLCLTLYFRQTARNSLLVKTSLIKYDFTPTNIYALYV
jgi:hypothetical protein